MEPLIRGRADRFPPPWSESIRPTMAAGRLICIILHAESTDSADRSHALFVGSESAIHRTTHAASVLRAPWVVLRFGWRA
jgi:hypothetical protein